MKIYASIIFVALVVVMGSCSISPSSNPENNLLKQAKQTMLFHTASSTDSPHRAVLPLLQAIAAKTKGHEAILAFGGDATLLMKDTVAADIKAVGQPTAGELLKKAVDLKIPIYI